MKKRKRRKERIKETKIILINKMINDRELIEMNENIKIIRIISITYNNDDIE